MKLVAIKSFSYAGKRIAAGEVFETKTDRDAKIMIGIKSARSIEGRTETKIPAPAKSLIENASAKVEVIIPEVKDDIEIIEKDKEEKAELEIFENEESKQEEVKEDELKQEESAIISEKPELASNANKRNYNKRK